MKKKNVKTKKFLHQIIFTAPEEEKKKVATICLKKFKNEKLKTEKKHTAPEMVSLVLNMNFSVAH